MRKIKRNIARKTADGNKGLKEMFKNLFNPTRNFDKEHIKMVKDNAFNQKRKAKEKKKEKDEKNKK